MFLYGLCHGPINSSLIIETHGVLLLKTSAVFRLTGSFGTGCIFFRYWARINSISPANSSQRASEASSVMFVFNRDLR